MARATTETASKSGLIRLIAHQEFFAQLVAMFPNRSELPKDELADGETVLGCRDCILHMVGNRKKRPAPLTADQIKEINPDQFFSGEPAFEFQELFLLCPALALATARGAGYFPCESIGLTPITHT